MGWQSAARVHPRARRVRLADASAARLARAVRYLVLAPGAAVKDTAKSCGDAYKETDHGK